MRGEPPFQPGPLPPAEAQRRTDQATAVMLAELMTSSEFRDWLNQRRDRRRPGRRGIRTFSWVASLLALVGLGLLVVTYNSLSPSFDLGHAKNAPVTAPTVSEPSDIPTAAPAPVKGPADGLLMSTTPAAVPADSVRATAATQADLSTAVSTLACDARAGTASTLDPDGAIGQLERTRAGTDDAVPATSTAIRDGVLRGALNTTALVAVVAQPKGLALVPAAPLPTSSPVWHTARDLLYTCSMLPPATSAPVPEPAQPPSVETPAPTEMPEDQALMRAEDATGPTARTYALVAALTASLLLLAVAAVWRLRPSLFVGPLRTLCGGLDCASYCLRQMLAKAATPRVASSLSTIEEGSEPEEPPIGSATRDSAAMPSPAESASTAPATTPIPPPAVADEPEPQTQPETKTFAAPATTDTTAAPPPDVSSEDDTLVVLAAEEVLEAAAAQAEAEAEAETGRSEEGSASGDDYAFLPALEAMPAAAAAATVAAGGTSGASGRVDVKSAGEEKDGVGLPDAFESSDEDAVHDALGAFSAGGNDENAPPSADMLELMAVPPWDGADQQYGGDVGLDGGDAGSGVGGDVEAVATAVGLRRRHQAAAIPAAAATTATDDGAFVLVEKAPEASAASDAFCSAAGSTGGPDATPCAPTQIAADPDQDQLLFQAGMYPAAASHVKPPQYDGAPASALPSAVGMLTPPEPPSAFPGFPHLHSALLLDGSPARRSHQPEEEQQQQQQQAPEDGTGERTSPGASTSDCSNDVSAAADAGSKAAVAAASVAESKPKPRSRLLSRLPLPGGTKPSAAAAAEAGRDDARRDSPARPAPTATAASPTASSAAAASSPATPDAEDSTPDRAPQPRADGGSGSDGLFQSPEAAPWPFAYPSSAERAVYTATPTSSTASAAAGGGPGSRTSAAAVMVALKDAAGGSPGGSAEAGVQGGSGGGGGGEDAGVLLPLPFPLFDLDAYDENGDQLTPSAGGLPPNTSPSASSVAHVALPALPPLPLLQPTPSAPTAPTPDSRSHPAGQTPVPPATRWRFTKKAPQKEQRQTQLTPRALASSEPGFSAAPAPSPAASAPDADLHDSVAQGTPAPPQQAVARAGHHQANAPDQELYDGVMATPAWPLSAAAAGPSEQDPAAGQVQGGCDGAYNDSSQAAEDNEAIAAEAISVAEKLSTRKLMLQLRRREQQQQQQQQQLDEKEAAHQADSVEASPGSEASVTQPVKRAIPMEPVHLGAPAPVTFSPDRTTPAQQGPAAAAAAAGAAPHIPWSGPPTTGAPVHGNRQEPARDFAAAAAVATATLSTINRCTRSVVEAAAAGGGGSPGVPPQAAMEELHAAAMQLLDLSLAPSSYTTNAAACKALAFSAAATPLPAALAGGGGKAAAAGGGGGRAGGLFVGGPGPAFDAVRFAPGGEETPLRVGGLRVESDANEAAGGSTSTSSVSLNPHSGSELHAQLTPLLRAVDAAVSGHEELLLLGRTASPAAAAAAGPSPDSAASSPTQQAQQRQQQQPTSGPADSEGGSWASFGSRVHPPVVQQEGGSSPQTDSGWWHSESAGEPSASLGSACAATPQSAASSGAVNPTPDGQPTPAAPDGGIPVTPASGASGTGASSVASAPSPSPATTLGESPRKASPAGTSPVGNILREVRDTASLLRITHDVPSPHTASGPASAVGSPTAFTPAAPPTAPSPLSVDPLAFTPATLATPLTDEEVTTPAKNIHGPTAAVAATSTPGSSPGWGEDAPRPCPPDSAVVAYLAARTAATTPTEGVLRHMQLSVVASTLRISSLAALATAALVEEQRWRARALAAEEQLRVLLGASQGALVDGIKGAATAGDNAAAAADELWEVVGGEEHGSARSSSGGWSSESGGVEQGEGVARVAGDGEAGEEVGGDGGASSDGELGDPELQHVLWEEAKAEEAARAREEESAEAEAVAALEAQQQQEGCHGQQEEVKEQGRVVAAPQTVDGIVMMESGEGAEVVAGSEAVVGADEHVLEQVDAVGGVLSQLVWDVEAGAAGSGEEEGEGVGGGSENNGAGGAETPLLYGFMEHLRSPPRSTPSGQSSAPMELEDATSFHATAATPGSMTKAEAEEEAGAEAGAVAGPDVVEEAEAAGAQSPATQLPLSVNAASCSGSSSAPPSAERLQERYPEQRSTPTRKLRFDLLGDGNEGSEPATEEGSASEDIPCIEDIPLGDKEEEPELQPQRGCGGGGMTDTGRAAMGAAGEKEKEEQPAAAALAGDGESEGSGVVVGRAGEEVVEVEVEGQGGLGGEEGGLGGEEGVESCSSGGSSDDEEGQATDLVFHWTGSGWSS